MPILRLLPEVPEKRLTKSRRLRAIEATLCKMRSTGKSAHKRERGRRYGGPCPTARSRFVHAAKRCSGVVIRGCGHKINVSVSIRNVALVYFCAIGSAFCASSVAFAGEVDGLHGSRR